MPEWVLHARKFVATDKQEFLGEAARVCGDPAIREFLDPIYLVYGELDANQAQPVVARLMSEGRKAEAVMMIILGFKKYALAPYSCEHLEEEQKEISKAACIQVASLSSEQGFMECEARFTLVLGTHHTDQHESRKALKLVRHALALYRKLADADPDLYQHAVAAALNNIGMILLKEGNLSEARRAFQEAEEIHRGLAELEPRVYRPFLAVTLHNLGVVLEAMREFAAAQLAYEEARQLQCEPTQSEARPCTEMFRFGDARSRRGDQDNLEKYSTKAKRTFMRARALLLEGRSNEAIKSFDELLEIYPNDTHVWYCKGIAQFEARKFDEALRSFDTAIGIDGNVYAWTGKAITLAEIGRYTEAVSSFEKAIDIDTQDEVPWNERGKSLAQLGRHEEAIKSFEKAIEIRPRYGMAWYNIGASLQKLCRHGQALESFDMAVTIDPQNANAWNEKGISLAQLGMPLIGNEDRTVVLEGLRLVEQAIKSWDKALEIDPNHTAARQNRQQFEEFSTP